VPLQEEEAWDTEGDTVDNSRSIVGDAAYDRICELFGNRCSTCWPGMVFNEDMALLTFRQARRQSAPARGDSMTATSASMLCVRIVQLFSALFGTCPGGLERFHR
jgi:hypothetical protein